MSYARRVDDNQSDIVRQIRVIGGNRVTVYVTSSVGKGFPDIVVGCKHKDGTRRNYLFEIKDGNKQPSARRLTPDEKMFFDAWAGQVSVIYTADEALEIMEII